MHNLITCPRCHGTGYITECYDGDQFYQDTCPECGGEKEVEADD